MVYTETVLVLSAPPEQLEDDANIFIDSIMIKLHEIKDVVVLNEESSETIGSAETKKGTDSGTVQSERKMRSQSSFTQSTHKMSPIKVAGATDMKNLVKITTSLDGETPARIYLFHMNGPEECTTVVQDLSKLSKAAKRRIETKSRLAKIQEKIRRIYSSAQVQGVVGVLIMAVSV
jgi:hypothetical protein